MRVVTVSAYLPHPANSGGRIRTLNLLTRLAKRHQVTMIANRHADPAESRAARSFLEDHGFNVVEVEQAIPSKSGPAFYLRLAANLASSVPYSVASHLSPAIENAVRAVAAKQPVDLWQAEWAASVEAFRSIRDARKIVMAPNVETLIWERYALNEANPVKRWYIDQQARKFASFERKTFAAAERVVTVTEDDAALVRDRFGMSRVDVVDNGIDRGFFESVKPDRDPRKLLFLGSLDWRPNLDAISLLLDTIFPLVLAEVPDATLDIVGRNPSEALRKRIEATPSARLHADVADIRPYLATSGAMVVPLRIGGGSRLKILESLATGLPVISTSFGAEGLELRDGQEIEIADAPEAIAQALARSIREPERSAGIAQKGRTLVLDRYDWDHLAEALERSWERCLT